MVKSSNGTVVFIPGNEERQFMNGSGEDFVFIWLIPSGVAEIQRSTSLSVRLR